mgnify:CR=1 FL=1
MNGTRLGTYPFFQRAVGANDPHVQGFFLRNVLAGATAGAIGAVVGR